MLCGCPNATVCTNHKNNTFNNVHTQRVMQWQLLLEEYGVKLQCIKGEHNHLADALSHLPFTEQSINLPHSNQTADLLASFCSMAIHDGNLLDCFAHLPASSGVPFVLDYQTTRDTQVGDAQLNVLRKRKLAAFASQLLAPKMHVACYMHSPREPWKIFLPTMLSEQAKLGVTLHLATPVSIV